MREKIVTQENSTLYKKKTTLRENLALLSEKIQTLREAMQCSKNIIIKPFIGLYLLHKSVLEKQSLLMEVSLTSSSIVTYINETKIPWALNNRMKQKIETLSSSIDRTMNMQILFALITSPNISEMCSNRPVSNSKIIQLGHLLEYTSITSLEDVFDSLNCSDCK